MNSRIYECDVMHARSAPKRHRFNHRIFMLALDLDELPLLDRTSRLFSVNRSNLYSFRERDYFPISEPLHNPSATAELPTSSRVTGSDASLKGRVMSWLSAHGIELPGGRVELVTMPRIAGYHFNPISLYFCYDAAGRAAAAIAEVTNTFREVKPYLLAPATWQDGAFHLRVPKHFYVSPFSDVDVEFDFCLRPPTERLSIRIDDYVRGERTLTSTLTGSARPLTGAALAWFTFKYPLLTLAVMARIHGHALALYLKKVRWFPKAARAADQRDLRRPHHSLTPVHPSRAAP
jgi:uncharacterized protein